MGIQIDESLLKKLSIGATEDQLKTMKRDLRFFPCRNMNPLNLSPQEIERFNQDGYLKGIDIFNEKEIKKYRSFFDKNLSEAMSGKFNASQARQAHGAKTPLNYSIVNAHLKFPDVYDILVNPKIVGIVRDLIGNNIIGWGCHYFCKLPNDGKTVAWHQDAPYWPQTPSKTVTAWLAIDDSDIENGCMRVVSGSHLHGPLKYRFSEPKENNVLYATVDDAEKYGKIVDIELSAGQISLHSDLLLHSSNYNNSKRRRCGLALRYNTTDVRLGNEFEHQLGGVLVSGEDKEDYWGNPSRPKKDLLI